MLTELRIDNLRTSRVKFETQPVQVAFANRSARKNKAFHWYADMDKLVGHAQTYLMKLKGARG